MTPRHRVLIIATALCHGLLTPPLVTSQLPTPSARPRSPSAAHSRANEEEVTIRAREQEKSGNVFTLRGDVEINFRDLTLRADQVTYDTSTGDITASGHVTLEGGAHDEHIRASHGTYNARDQTGRFYDVVAMTGRRFQGKKVVLTSSSPFAFSGKEVIKTGPTHYEVRHGSVTACALPHPKWSFNTSHATVDAGQEARIYNSTFRILGIPVFYFPFASQPVDRLGRHTGLLIPTFGQSSRKGTILGESFYWAINRSMDTTIGAEYFSKRGWAQHGEFRARESETSFINVRYLGVLDRGFGPTKIDQGGQDIHLNAEALFPHGFRGVTSLNYLSSFVFRLAFTEQFTQAVDSEVKSVAFLSRTWRGFSFNSMAERDQNFQSTLHADRVTILHAPSLEASSVERSVRGSRLVCDFDAEAGGVSRHEPGFSSADLVARFDFQPSVALPLLYHGWSIRPQVGGRDTYYGQRLAPNGGPSIPLDRDVNRRALESSMELRPPALARIFERPVRGRTLKHTIEPRLIYRYVDGVDNFSKIIRFDARDILSNTNELEAGVIHRIYAKTPLPPSDCGAPPTTAKPEKAILGLPGTSRTMLTPQRPAECATGGRVRQILSWELAAKYFFDPNFGGALVPGKRNVLTTTAEFAGIAFLTEPRRFSPIVSKLRVETSANTDVQWELDYDAQQGRINSSTALVNHRMGEFFIGGSHAFLHVPGEIFVSNPLPAPNEFNQFRVLLGYGHPNKRGISGAANVGFDANLGFLQYSAFQTSYNWDCCGLSVEFRRLALGSVRNENQARFALTLANIGTFGNLRRQERLF